MVLELNPGIRGVLRFSVIDEISCCEIHGSPGIISGQYLLMVLSEFFPIINESIREIHKSERESVLNAVLGLRSK